MSVRDGARLQPRAPLTLLLWPVVAVFLVGHAHSTASLTDYISPSDSPAFASSIYGAGAPTAEEPYVAISRG